MPYVSYQISGGLNTKADVSEVQDSQVARARGCRFDRAGAISSERTRSKLNPDALAGAIRGTGEYYNGTTVKRVTKALNTVYEDLATTIGTFSGDDDITVESYNGYAYITDGTDFKRWDGTTLEAVGLDAPTTAPTAALVTGSTGFYAAGDYKYVVTFFNGVAESNFSPHVRATVLDVTHVGVNLTDIPTGPASTTSRRIYRTLTNGNAFFFLTELEDNTTTTYSDATQLPPEADDTTDLDNTTSSSDADVTDTRRPIDLRDTVRSPATITPSQTTFTRPGWGPATWRVQPAAGEPPQIVQTNLGVLVDWTNHDVPPSGLRQLRSMNDQLFGVLDNSVRFTLTSQPEHWPILNQFPVGRQTGETLQTIEPFGSSQMVCYTDSDIYVFSMVGVTPADARLDNINSPVGIVSPEAVASLEFGGHVFMATNGLYLFDGQQVQEISFAVEDLFTNSQHEDYVNPAFQGTVKMAAYRDKIRISYGTTTANDRVMTVDLQDRTNPKFATKRDDLTTLFREVKGNRPIAGDSSGFLYELDTDGNSDDVEWGVDTKAYPLNSTSEMIAVEEVTIDADFGGASTTVLVVVEHEGQRRSAGFTTTATGRQRIKKRMPNVLKGSTAQVVINSTSKAQRHLYSVGYLVEAGGEP